MSWPVRLFEKLTGTPHRHDNATRVSLAAEELTETTRELSTYLKPYLESDDPLVSLMTDVFNKRQMGPGDGQSKFRS